MLGRISKKSKNFDVKSLQINKGWFYSETVKNHFLHPRNFWRKIDKRVKWNGVGTIGSPACGDVMRMWIYVDPKTEKIKKCQWQTFGCASAIASTSMLSTMMLEKGGLPIEKALRIKPQDIMKRLGGLPARKIHCSVLGDKALRSAINDYFRRSKQYGKIMPEGFKIVDRVLNITDKDIEEAVKNGAKTLKEIQEITKVGLGDPKCVPEAEELIRFYKEKYYGC